MKSKAKLARGEIKVCMVLQALDAGGIEAFALSVTENINKDRFSVDYLLATDIPHFYDDRILANGNRIFYTYRLLNLKNMVKHFLKMFRIFKTQKYDVVHTNMDFFNGVNILAAKLAGCKKIICHSHNTCSANGKGVENEKVKLYHLIMGVFIRKADIKLGCSSEACEWMYGKKWKANGCIVVHNAIDTIGRFNLNLYNREELRKKYKLQSDCMNILSIGRLSEQKNSVFLIDISHQLKELGITFHLGIVGTGEKNEEIKRKIAQYGLEKNVYLYGNRNDIPEILTAYDYFLFPSRWEGFSIALIEAQFMVNICYISDNVSPESNIGKCISISLESSAKEWAEVIVEKSTQNLSLNQDAVTCTMPYFINEIEKIYSDKCL